MSGTALRLPDLGEGVEEGIVVAVLVAAGDRLTAEQAVLEIETDKVTLEVPAPRPGVVQEICVAVDATVRPGDIVLRLDEDAESEVVAEKVVEKVVEKVDVADENNDPSPEHTTTAAIPDSAPAIETAGIVPAGPAARREARELGVDIAMVDGTAKRGRITREDVRRFVKGRQLAPSPNTPVASNPLLPDLGAFGSIRRESLSGIERATASNLTRSANLIPHAWIERRIEISLLEETRRRMRNHQDANAAPLTLTAILCKALATVLGDFPKFNAAFDEHAREVVYREYRHIGVAVDTDRGLLVPVLRDADKLDIIAIADELASLSSAARDNTLRPEQIRGAGITISNLGGLGVSAIQPIVNWPQVAILGVAAAQTSTALVDGAMVAQLHLPLTLGFDHRLINGADAARFLAAIDDALSNPLALALLDG